MAVMLMVAVSGNGDCRGGRGHGGRVSGSGGGGRWWRQWNSGVMVVVEIMMVVAREREDVFRLGD